MCENIHGAAEERRNALIAKLIDFNFYKIAGKHLFELPINELENEYRKQMQSQTHPHSGMTSIRWVNRKAVN